MDGQNTLHCRVPACSAQTSRTPCRCRTCRTSAHHRDAVAPAAPDDHLGRPTLPKLLLEELPHLVRELPPLCGLHGDAVLGHALGLLVPVSFLASVAFKLSADGRTVTPDTLCTVGGRFPLFLQSPNYDTILACQAVIFRRPGWDPIGCLHVHTCLLVFCLHKKV